MENTFTLGLDFGSDSVRCVIADTRNGAVIGTDVFSYPRWNRGLFCDPSECRYRQHPQDYLDGLVRAVRGALRKAPRGTAERVVGLSVDTTGSTPVAVNEQGTPLARLPEFKDNPNAMFVLWKDHTAVQEAEEINQLCAKWKTDYTAFEGGIYSPEWFWAKILHILRHDARVRKAAFSWVEHCDWISADLTGNTNPLEIKRSRCAAGHKAMWHENFNGLPSEKFLEALDPRLRGLRNRLYRDTFTCDTRVGGLTESWARKLGLPSGIAVGIGAFDCHMGAIGAEIRPGQLVRVMGTSTCDILVVPPSELNDRRIRGICGQVDGSVLPGMIGLEAGQSAFGDVYAWFSRLILGPVREQIRTSAAIGHAAKQKWIAELEAGLIPDLSRQAAARPVGSSGITALDWHNGRRTPDANPYVRGAISGLTLGSDAVGVFQSLVEATAFGSRLIFDRFKEEGVRIDSVTAIGGVARKSPVIMQTLADVLRTPIRVVRSEQTCALGAAMAASVAAGVHATVPHAQKAMGHGFETTYRPNRKNATALEAGYARYKALGQFAELSANRIGPG